MFTYQGNRRATPSRRRSRWFLAGGVVAGSLVVGAAGVTGVAALAAPRAPGVTEQGRVAAAARDDGPDAGRRTDDGTPGRPHRPDGRPDEEGAPDGRPDGPGTRRPPLLTVPCDSARLIAALVQANAEGGATVRLAPKCTYTLSHAFQQPDEYDGGIRDAREAADAAENPGDAERPPRQPGDDNTGLPLIYQAITVEGSGATIARGENAETFRFFTVRDGGELTLRDIVLRNGRSTSEGGSVHVVHGATAVLERTTVVDSTSLSAKEGGGGVFNDGNMVVRESRFIGNSAVGVEGKGGGVLNGGVLTMSKTEFRDNSANGYGGGLANYRGAAEVATTLLAHNIAGQGGGLASFSARTKVEDTRVVDNTAKVGGGIANSDAVLVLRKLVVQGNTASGNGGGISSIQGLLPMDDSVVAGNHARGNGGGIFADRSNILVRTSEVSDNAAIGAKSTGGGIHTSAGQLSLFKSKVVGNSSTLPPGGIFADRARVRIDDASVVIENRSTNCAGSKVPISHCFR
ncbi:membrane protein [Micromonospora sp. ATCC 39149]|uniref:Right-handed parallel beta-helix repeat-containing protein n=1 Tax=Micromonospora carbonacea TaxID=47853 RepID=A0A7D6GK74_9ACTN|nr:membrane protein [Micromonospora sp. ATCC 39149]QLK01470.1 hypothetical protein HZU44_16205 [Micromonospora carbonacea]